MYLDSVRFFDPISRMPSPYAPDRRTLPAPDSPSPWRASPLFDQLVSACVIN